MCCNSSAKFILLWFITQYSLVREFEKNEFEDKFVINDVMYYPNANNKINAAGTLPGWLITKDTFSYPIKSTIFYTVHYLESHNDNNKRWVDQIVLCGIISSFVCCNDDKKWCCSWVLVKWEVLFALFFSCAWLELLLTLIIRLLFCDLSVECSVTTNDMSLMCIASNRCTSCSNRLNRCKWVGPTGSIERALHSSTIAVTSNLCISCGPQSHQNASTSEHMHLLLVLSTKLPEIAVLWTFILLCSLKDVLMCAYALCCIYNGTSSGLSSLCLYYTLYLANSLWWSGWEWFSCLPYKDLQLAIVFFSSFYTSLTWLLLFLLLLYDVLVKCVVEKDAFRTGVKDRVMRSILLFWLKLLLLLLLLQKLKLLARRRSAELGRCGRSERWCQILCGMAIPWSTGLSAPWNKWSKHCKLCNQSSCITHLHNTSLSMMHVNWLW